MSIICLQLTCQKLHAEKAVDFPRNKEKSLIGFATYHSINIYTQLCFRNIRKFIIITFFFLNNKRIPILHYCHVSAFENFHRSLDLGIFKDSMILKAK